MTIYAIQNPVYNGAMRAILSITNATNALVTTTINGIDPADHGYITGIIVRLDFPPGFGMAQANGKTGTIIVTSSSTFTIDIDTTNYEPYVTPTYWPRSYQRAQVVPIAENNSILTGAVQNIL